MEGAVSGGAGESVESMIGGRRMSACECTSIPVCHSSFKHNTRTLEGCGDQI